MWRACTRAGVVTVGLVLAVGGCAARGGGAAAARVDAGAVDAAAGKAPLRETCATPERLAAEAAAGARPDFAGIEAEIGGLEGELREVVEGAGSGKAGLRGLGARLDPLLARLDAARARAGAPAMAGVLKERLTDAAVNGVMCGAVAADDGARCDALGAIGAGRADGCRARVLLVRRLGVDMVARRACTAAGAKRAAALLPLVPAALVAAMCQAAVGHDAAACAALKVDPGERATCAAAAGGDLSACAAAGTARRVEVCRQDVALLASASGGVIVLGGAGVPALGADDALLVEVASGRAEAAACTARIGARVHDELEPAVPVDQRKK